MGLWQWNENSKDILDKTEVDKRNDEQNILVGAITVESSSQSEAGESSEGKDKSRFRRVEKSEGKIPQVPPQVRISQTVLESEFSVLILQCVLLRVYYQWNIKV